MTKNELRTLVAKRVAKELKTGDLVNLGIGMPTLVTNFISTDQHIIFQSENGMVGIDASPSSGEEDWDLTNAGGQPITAISGAAYFDSATSFQIIRGGHVDITILGALEVDEKGNLANWIIPNKMVAGMGGAMDLVNGAKKVIIMMDHCNKNGEAKILPKCRLPLTAANQVNLIVTELAVIEISEEGLVLKEIAGHTSVEEVQDKTEAKLIIASDLGVFN
jgi:3-oxoacid CoA-transferase B subunit